MASQPPPGYNAEASLLQGGTTPILPVQGGGGDLPPSTYNPSVSLLQGGVGTIDAVRGGGGVSFSQNLEVQREFSKNAPVKNVSRASRAYSLELYSLEKEKSIKTLDTDLQARQRRLLQYTSVGKKTELLTSLQSLPAGAFAFTEYPKYGDCKPSLPVNYFTALPKRVHFFDPKPHTLWVIPNLRGEKEVFEYVTGLIAPEGTLPGKDHILVFTGTFYPDRPSDTSLFLFDELLKLKQKNPNQVFVLSSPNAMLLNNGCYILEHTYAMKTTLAKQQGKSKDVPTFFEPDVLVFPYEQIILRSSELPISADSKVSVGLLLKKGVRSISYLIKAQAGRKVEPAPYENFVTILSNPNQSETRSWPKRSEQSIKCPKDDNCKNFELGFALDKLGLAPTVNLLDQKLFLFHITLEKIPYFTGYQEAEETTVEKEEEEVEEEEEIEEDEIIPIATIVKPKAVKGPYKEDPSATPSASSVTVNVEGISYTLRVPFSASNTDEVKTNWTKEIFTDGEAKLLNALQLTPAVLKKAFGMGYKWRVSNFLASLTVSSCFKEASLLLKSECDDARQFLRKVSFVLQSQCLTTLSNQWGTPVEGTVVETASISETLEKPVAEEAVREEAETEEVVEEEVVEEEPEEEEAEAEAIGPELRQLTKNLEDYSLDDLTDEQLDELLEELEATTVESETETETKAS